MSGSTRSRTRPGAGFSEDLSFFVRVAGVDTPTFVHTGIQTAHDKGGIHLHETGVPSDSRHDWIPIVRVAAVSDEPSNTASEFLRNAYAFFESGLPTEKRLRAGLTDDFAYEDRRSGPSMPDADAESYPKLILACGEPVRGNQDGRVETLAVRGERFAAVAVQADYGNGMLGAAIQCRRP